MYFKAKMLNHVYQNEFQFVLPDEPVVVNFSKHLPRLVNVKVLLKGTVVPIKRNLGYALASQKVRKANNLCCMDIAPSTSKCNIMDMENRGKGSADPRSELHEPNDL